MATGSRPDSIFYGMYDEYVGEARTKPEVYGYWILVLGLIAALAGVGLFLLDEAVNTGLSQVWVFELTVVLGAVGGVGLLLGSVLQLPLRRRAIHVAVVGSVLSVAAAGLFMRLYPRAWDLGSNLESLAVVVGYAGGVTVVALVAALIPVLTGRRGMLVDEESPDELAWVEEDDAVSPHQVSTVMAGEATRDGVFAVFPSDSGWRWWFVEQAAVADAQRRHETQEAAEDALTDVRAKVDAAGLLEVNHAAFRIYRDDEGVRWTLVDEDGGVLADSDGTYADRQQAEHAVNLLKEHGPDATLLAIDDAAFELYSDGEAWYWRLVDEDRTVLASGPEGYDERDDAGAGLGEVRELLPESELMDVEYVGFELVKADDGDWHWEVVDGEDTTIAESADEFETRVAAEKSIRRIMEGAIDMPLLTAGSPGYEVIQAEDGGWRWRLVDGEDDVVAVSEDVVPSEESGRSVVDRVKDAVADADVVEIDDAEFEIYKEGSVWAWRLVTEDRRTIARSPPSAEFPDPETARVAVDRVRAQVDGAEHIEFDSAAFHLYEAEEGSWNWRLIDSDGSIISDSGQEHYSRDDAASAMSTLKEHAPDAELVEIETAATELYRADDDWHWRLVDAAGNTLATSPGRHTSAEAARNAIDALELLAPDAGVRTMDAAIFQVYVSEDEPRQWRWRLVHPDGNVIATSAAGFPAREEAEAAASRVSGFAGDATVHTLIDLAVRFTVERSEGPDGDQREEWVWEVVDRERTVLATGTATYPSRDAVATPAKLVRDNAGAASVFRVDPAAGRLEETEEGWRWRLVDEHRNTLAVDGRFHDSRESARVAYAGVRDVAGSADLLDFDLAAFEIGEQAGAYRWLFVDTTGNVVGASGADFESREAAEEALASVRELLPAASLLEIESPAFELHEDGTDWRWRLVDTDGSTVAESMRTYPTRREARDALESLRQFGGDAPAEITT